MYTNPTTAHNYVAVFMRYMNNPTCTQVCVQALSAKEASKRSLDLVSRKEGVGTVTTDFPALFRAVKGTCDYSVRTTATPRS
jgi:hypothetical protein